MSHRTVEVPEKMTPQDADGNKPESITEGHHDAGVNLNAPATSKKESEGPENRKRGNTEPAKRERLDESPSLEPITETTTIDDIPNTEFHADRISGTVYNADINTDYFMDEAVTHDVADVLQQMGSGPHDFVVMTDHRSDFGGVVEDTVQPRTSEFGGIVEDTVQPKTSEFGGIVEDTVQPKTSEFGGIVEDTVQPKTSEFGGIVEVTVQPKTSEFGGIVEDTVQSRTSEFGVIVEDTVQPKTSEFGGIVEDTVQPKTSEFGGTVEDTVQPKTSEFGGIVEYTIQPKTSEFGGTVKDTVQPKTSEFGSIVEDTVQPKTSEFGGIVEDTVQPKTSEFGGIVEDTVQPRTSEFGGIVEDTVQPKTSEFGGIVEDTVQPKTSEFGGTVEDTVQPKTSEFGGFVEYTIQPKTSEFGGTVEDTVQPRTSEFGGVVEDTVQPKTSEFGGIVEDTVQPKTSEFGGTVEDTVQPKTSEFGGIVEDTVQSRTSEFGGIVEDTVQPKTSEFGGIVEDTVQPKTSEFGGIVEDTVQPKTSEFGGIVEDTVQPRTSEFGGIVEDTVQPKTSEFGGIVEDTVQPKTSEFGGIVEDTVQPKTSEFGGIVEDTVQPKTSEFGGIVEDTVQPKTSEFGGIVEDTVQPKTSEFGGTVEDTVQPKTSEFGGTVEDTVQPKTSEFGGIVEDTVQPKTSEFGGTVEDTVQPKTSEFGGIVEDTVQPKTSEFGGTVEDTVQPKTSEFGGIVEDTVQPKTSEFGGIVEDTVQPKTSEFGGIVEDTVQSRTSEFGGIVEDTVQPKTSDFGGIVEDTVQPKTSEFGGIVEDTVQPKTSEFGGIVEDTVQPRTSEFGGISEDSIQGRTSEFGGIVEDTVQPKTSEFGGVSEDTVQPRTSEFDGILPSVTQSTALETDLTIEDAFQHIHSKMCGMLEDTVQSTESEILSEDQSINSELGCTVEDSPGLLQQPVLPYSSELTNNNNNSIPEADDNNAMSDILADSAANSVDNDVTQMSESSTVNVKTEMESASCILEELVPDIAVEQTTENNSEVCLLISSFPHSPILMPSKTEEVPSGIPQTLYTFDETWVDALDEWEDLPTSCTGTSEMGTNTMDLPTIERWSSSDSWASALSDWVQSTSVLPEDSPALRSPESQDRLSRAAKDTDEEKATSLGSFLQSGDGVSEEEMMIPTSVNLSPELLFQLDESVERERRLVRLHLDRNRTLSEDRRGERRSGLHEGVEDPGGILENKSPCASKPDGNSLGGASDEGAFEENGGGVGLEGCEAAQLMRMKDGGSRAFPSAGEDFIMPLIPITIGTSFLDSKEEPGDSRTSLKSSLAGINEEIGVRSDGKAASESSDKQTRDASSSCEDGDVGSERQTLILSTGERLTICDQRHVAYLTLDVHDILSFKSLPEDRSALNPVGRGRAGKMPHKSKASSETRSNKHKDKPGNSAAAQSKNRENVQECAGGDDHVTAIETVVITEKVASRPQGKKKKKKQAVPKVESELRLSKDETPPASKMREKLAKHEGKETSGNETASEEKAKPATETASPAADDDIIKRRRISGDKAGSVPVRARPQLPAIFQQKKNEDVTQTKVHATKEVARVLTEIEAAPVVDDPQSISLWCRFSSIKDDSSIVWVKEGATLHEEKKKVGDDGRVSLSLLKACSKDLGFYRCTLISARGSVSTSDYHLTSEVLMELVIPDHATPVERKATDEEDVSCAPLLFKDDILNDQYFGEKQHTSILTEKAHFGEGMHRKAFRTMIRTGMTPLFGPGHACVLKVHSSIGYGTQNEQEVVQKNYNLAVEECYVQNTAREYIKAYTDVAKSAESFGEVPEIIPIFLVHRPSNAVPYATLEEELMGDFVKYSVRDGKEINLMRRDSEAGQKCCAFQHWVYTQTDGNLLVTDMQGVGMKLTDVGIATCKKGYKGFKGNCSTSFIDQFKALHQCNRFCELLGLASLQPKAKTQPAARKKTLAAAAVKGKS